MGAGHSQGIDASASGAVRGRGASTHGAARLLLEQMLSLPLLFLALLLAPLCSTVFEPNLQQTNFYSTFTIAKFLLGIGVIKE